MRRNDGISVEEDNRDLYQPLMVQDAIEGAGDRVGPIVEQRRPPLYGNPFARQAEEGAPTSTAEGGTTTSAATQPRQRQRQTAQNGNVQTEAPAAGSTLVQALLPASRADSMCSAASHSEPRQQDDAADLTRQTSILHSLGTQPEEVALRVLTVRTDAVTGLPLDVYQEPPTARFRPPGQLLHMPDMEEAEAKWQRGQPLVALWMAGSAVSLLSSLFWLPLGFIGGLLGIAGASLMLCRCHHCFSFALAVKGTQVLASICMVLSAFLAAVLLYTVVVIRCSNQQHSARYCQQLTWTLCILVVWHSLHAVLCGAVSAHSSNVKRLLDPVKSGVILLPRQRSEAARQGP